ncbi:GDP-mannose 4,6-dehydratase [Patescibacteria group bacterium]|nr:GDP-mannose 4,6-dehydratase [Patescibacteria group bacterium]
MPKWVYNAGNKQLELILKAMMDGDGSWGTMTYISNRKDLIHDFQTIATILGYRTTLHSRKSGMHECCLISKRKKYAYVTDCKKEKSSEQIWCVTTKNGTIVTNKDSGIAVSGNCEAMWLMLQQKNPDDYVVATGENHSIKEFVQEAFKCAGVTNWQKHIQIDKRFLRPAEVDYLRGNCAKAKKKLGWKPKTSFKELVKIMVEADINKLRDK